MAEPRPKPSITILYDADEERVRDAALAKGEKFPTLVSYQIETALTGLVLADERLRNIEPLRHLDLGQPSLPAQSAQQRAYT